MEYTKLFEKIRIGLILCIFAAFNYASANIMAFEIVEQVGAIYIAGIRFMFQTIFAVPFILKNPEMLAQLDKNTFLMITMSGGFLSISSMTSYQSFLYIPVADATVIFNSNIVVVLVASFVWLKEDIGKFDIINMMITLTGIFFVTQPTFLFGTESSHGSQSTSWIGYLTALLTSISTGLGIVCIRKVHTAGTPVILLIQGLFVMTMTLLLDIITNSSSDPDSSMNWLYLFGAGIVSSIGRGVCTLALSYEDSSIVASFMTSEILFTMIFQIALYGIYPTVIGTIGSILVIYSVIALSVKYSFLLMIHELKEKFRRRSDHLNEKKPLISP